MVFSQGAEQAQQRTHYSPAAAPEHPPAAPIIMGVAVEGVAVAVQANFYKAEQRTGHSPAPNQPPIMKQRKVHSLAAQAPNQLGAPILMPAHAVPVAHLLPYVQHLPSDNNGPAVTATGELGTPQVEGIQLCYLPSDLCPQWVHWGALAAGAAQQRQRQQLALQQLHEQQQLQQQQLQQLQQHLQHQQRQQDQQQQQYQQQYQQHPYQQHQHQHQYQQQQQQHQYQQPQQQQKQQQLHQQHQPRQQQQLVTPAPCSILQEKLDAVAREDATMITHDVALRQKFDALVMCDFTPRHPSELHMSRWVSYQVASSHAPITMLTLTLTPNP